MLPLFGVISHAIRLSNVDLPEPLDHINEANVHDGIVKSKLSYKTSSLASGRIYDFVTFVKHTAEEFMNKQKK